ncbi:MAG: hypothetical protein ACYDAS_00420 [Patescibacteria group bacterium]
MLIILEVLSIIVLIFLLAFLIELIIVFYNIWKNIKTGRKIIDNIGDITNNIKKEQYFIEDTFFDKGIYLKAIKSALFKTSDIVKIYKLFKNKNRK